MSIHLVASYWIGLVGAAIGLIVGLLVVRAVDHGSRVSPWDARATLPLLLAAGLAHLSLIPVVELQRQVLFGLYGAALIGVVLFALLGIGIWRLGAVVFPLGSIGAYVYFGLSVHQVDYIGLLVKLVEVATIAAAILSVLRSRGATRAVVTSG